MLVKGNRNEELTVYALCVCIAEAEKTMGRLLSTRKNRTGVNTTGVFPHRLVYFY
jgi:hypothetical protein